MIRDLNTNLMEISANITLTLMLPSTNINFLSVLTKIYNLSDTKQIFTNTSFSSKQEQFTQLSFPQRVTLDDAFMLKLVALAITIRRQNLLHLNMRPKSQLTKSHWY